MSLATILDALSLVTHFCAFVIAPSVAASSALLSSIWRRLPLSQPAPPPFAFAPPSPAHTKHPHCHRSKCSPAPGPHCSPTTAFTPRSQPPPTHKHHPAAHATIHGSAGGSAHATTQSVDCVPVAALFPLPSGAAESEIRQPQCQEQNHGDRAPRLHQTAAPGRSARRGSSGSPPKQKQGAVGGDPVEGVGAGGGAANALNYKALYHTPRNKQEAARMSVQASRHIRYAHALYVIFAPFQEPLFFAAIFAVFCAIFF